MPMTDERKLLSRIANAVFAIDAAIAFAKPDQALGLRSSRLFLIEILDRVDYELDEHYKARPKKVRRQHGRVGL